MEKLISRDEIFVGQTFRQEWGGWVRITSIGSRDVSYMELDPVGAKKGWELGSAIRPIESVLYRIQQEMWIPFGA